MANTANTGTGIDTKRRELIAKRLEKARRSDTPARQVTRAADRALITPARRMWFLDELGQRSYLVTAGYRLRGPLDADRLRAALQTVAGRHDVLRSTFAPAADGEPIQHVHDDPAVEFTLVDLAKVPAPAQDELIAEVIGDEAGRGIDLRTQRPWRILLIRTGEDEHIVVFVVHHICWDNDSWQILFDELESAYAATDLPELRNQYGDTDPEVHDRAALQYWRSVLTPPPEPLDLGGRNESGRRTRREGAGRIRADLPPALSDDLAQLARACRTTPFAVLLAAFATAVHRHTEAEDLLVSIPVVNRTGAAEEAVIGYFGNAVLVRIRVRPGETLRELISDVGQSVTAARARQHVGIDTVVRDVDPGRGTGADPMGGLVQLSFTARGDGGGPVLDGITAEALDVGTATAYEPLGAVMVQGETTGLELTFDQAHLSEDTASSLLETYLQTLSAAAADPDVEVRSPELLGAAQRALIARSAHGRPVVGAPYTLTALLDDALRGPGIALSDNESAKVSYQELGERANRLGRRLIERGIGPEDIVALHLPSSAEFVVAVLATLKAGAAYLPIDPDYPGDRVDLVVADAAPTVLLTAAEVRAEEARAAAYPATDIADDERRRPLSGDNLAYVIYTSGSTGVPKGVAISHRAIAAHVRGFADDFTMNSDDVVLQSTSIAFDASLLDLFVTFVAGAELVIPPAGSLRTLAYVEELTRRERISVLHLVPSALSAFALAADPADWPSLRLIPVGGEALAGDMATAFSGRFGGRLRNHYGPTECVVCSTHFDIPVPSDDAVVPIGVPNRGVSVAVLDRTLRPVPIGVVGEVYIGGEQLARGYLGRPDLTAARFIADPQSPGRRLYRSGDLALRRRDGVLEFVGRSDEQVKVRGHRVEPGETAAVLNTHPAVAHAVVLPDDDPERGTRLIAYVVPTAAATGTATVQTELPPLDDAARGELLDHVRNTLPEYMVPESIVPVPVIPRTVHGKIDRAALPAPDVADPAARRRAAPGDEQRVAEIFAEVLGVDEVGADESFFDRGGHSLLASRLTARLREEFGCELSMRTVFEQPTVAEMALEVAASPSDSGRPPLVATPHDGELALTYSQMAIWFGRTMDDEARAIAGEPAEAARGVTAMGNIPLSVHLTGPLDSAALLAAAADVIAKHEALRTVVYQREGVPRQRVTAVGELSPDVAAVDCDPELVADLLARDAGVRFAADGAALMLAVRLYRTGPDEHTLSVVIDHLIADHWTFQTFFADLAAAYRARRSGRDPELVPDAVQYADFCAWQHRLFGTPGRGEPMSEFGERQLEFWRRELAGVPDRINVAPDRDRPAVIGTRGASATRSITPDHRRRLHALQADLGVSEFMACRAAVAVLLHRLSGSADVTIGSPLASRTSAATHEMIGLLANLVVLRTTFGDGMTIADLLSEVRASTLDVFENQELPIERLVDAIKPPRSPGYNPLYQTLLQYQGDDWDPSIADFGGDGRLQLDVLPVESDLALLDLGFGFRSGPDGSLDLTVIVNTDLYQPESASTMAERLLLVMEAIAADPAAPVDEIDLLLPGERQMLDAEAASGTPSTDRSPAGDPAQRVAERRAEYGPGCATRLIVTADAPADDLDVERAAAAHDGAELIEVPDAQTDTVALARLIRDRRPAVVIAEPGVLSALSHSGMSDFGSVRHWVSTDPAIRTGLRDLLVAFAGGSQLTSRLTLGDAGVVATGTLDGDMLVLTPADRCGATVVDGHGRPVPPAVPGELRFTTAAGTTIATGMRAARRGPRRYVSVIPVRDTGGPAPEQREYRAAETPTEQLLAQVLTDLLGQTQVGMDDGFFALGGDSVMALQLASRANESGLPLTPRMVFEHDTIGELAAQLDTLSAQAADAPGDPTTEVEHEQNLSGLSEEELEMLTAAWEEDGR